MRYLQFIIAIAVCALAGLSTADARHRAEYVLPAIQDIYCLKGRPWGYPGICQFSTYGQCMATASGAGGYCHLNPFYAFAQHRWQQR
ncbi:DUF3551 domain-containing protein [Bradyrhizobium sp. CB2312]|uniref:DUF3551 domain-containing protein n=1 Tax=Bradyrhizobium sp. CB2312 TaxID=3039155 RepID=UPI0024B06963|nr:DUF3551 domain-containing protein [Bradyrhizobium sp. CB2312]WFU71315.1 DUF3551 domain-containing protein [Bradyrhizobium sp. CB2312]